MGLLVLKCKLCFALAVFSLISVDKLIVTTNFSFLASVSSECGFPALSLLGSIRDI